ncbi:sulfite exporter TauE/SafE family protein [Halosimplex salinum]|uniref:sulfite exporter TauE/SafE family protein n=1 Tax=Halosimplex salinum TaxID=1710538 RepID=UPI000F4ABEAF|nr:sulfite exporter TauE/SafE family protein [Halosimplex salinum]
MSNPSPETDPAFPEPVDYAEPAIDRAARRLDEKPIGDRVRLRRRTRRRLTLLVTGYLVVLAASVLVVDDGPADSRSVRALFLPGVFLAGFVFETLDSASGMGFGTSLTPLLLSFGYAPLEVVPVLFVTETVTGLLAGALHHEFENVQFSVTPPLTDATRAVALLAGVGILGTLASIGFAYLVVELPERAIEIYVALLVIAMGVIGLLRQFLPSDVIYRPRRLAGFALLAGINKGISGGGYGPIATLGQIYAGVYEKTATAITSLAEGMVSLVGALAYFGLFLGGFPIEYGLFPSLFTGAFFAAIVAPYLVRVLPGRVLEYLIPLYAFAIGAFALLQLTG